MNELLPEQLKERVRDLLLNHAPMKDNDRVLMSAIWMQECDKAVDFLTGFMAGDYTCPESIRRCRQQLQEKHINLRGNAYVLRKTRANTIRTQIVKNSNNIKHKRVFVEATDMITLINNNHKVGILDYITSNEFVIMLTEFLDDDRKTSYVTINGKSYYAFYNSIESYYEFYKS